MPFFKLGKTHVPHLKNTADMPAVKMPPPDTVRISTSQHIGAPATLTVKPGDKVYVGTKIGEATAYVSSPIHSSVSGTVKKLDELLTSAGRKVLAAVIESDGLMTPDPDIMPPKIESLDDLSEAVKQSGLVGLGGAGFPTAVKIDGAKKRGIKRLILNGAECEPYITSDTRTMLDNAELVKGGVDIIKRFISPLDVYIGIEKNKPECIEKMKEVFASDASVRVIALPDTYPQGAEKILIYNTTGEIVPEGKLPSDVGCMVMNVTSLAFLASYVNTGMPLVEKRVTVDGSAIKSPMNVIAPIGSSMRSVIEFTGGFKSEPGKVMLGGPMMGVAVYNLDDPIMKNTNAIVALNKGDVRNKKTIACIHCGRCVSACPMGLNPTLYAKAMNVDDHKDRAARLDAAKINLCMECGCCSYVCPSARPLVQTNRLAKAELREYNANQAKK